MSADNAYAVELKGVSFKRGARSIFNNVDIRIQRGPGGEVRVAHFDKIGL